MEFKDVVIWFFVLKSGDNPPTNVAKLSLIQPKVILPWDFLIDKKGMNTDSIKFLLVGRASKLYRQRMSAF